MSPNRDLVAVDFKNLNIFSNQECRQVSVENSTGLFLDTLHSFIERNSRFVIRETRNDRARNREHWIMTTLLPAPVLLSMITLEKMFCFMPPFLLTLKKKKRFVFFYCGGMWRVQNGSCFSACGHCCIIVMALNVLWNFSLLPCINVIIPALEDLEQKPGKSRTQTTAFWTW